jgi:hypothetical protein
MAPNDVNLALWDDTAWIDVDKGANDTPGDASDGFEVRPTPDRS